MTGLVAEALELFARIADEADVLEDGAVEADEAALFAPAAILAQFVAEGAVVVELDKAGAAVPLAFDPDGTEAPAADWGFAGDLA